MNHRCLLDVVRAPAWVLVAALLAGTGSRSGAARVAPTVVELGRIAVGETRTHVLEVPNPGPSEMAIDAVSTSCDCVLVLNFSRTVPAGSGGTIELLILGEASGEFGYEVVVRVSGGEPIERVFRLDVSVGESAARDGAPLTAAFAGVPPRTVKTRKLDLYLTPQRLRAWRREDDTLCVVDVRDPAVFERGHIPGAINMPLFAVKSKGFLRGRTVVLVDDGWRHAALEGECRRLRALGMDTAKILAGGVQAWAAQGGDVAGRPGGGLGPATPSADDFMAARHANNGMVVDVGKGMTTAVRSDRRLSSTIESVGGQRGRTRRPCGGCP